MGDHITWHEMAQAVKRRKSGSLAYRIAWYGYDPRNYDYAHIYDDSKIEGTEEYQKLIDWIWDRNMDHIMSVELTAIERKRKPVQLSPSSQPQPGTKATVAAAMTDSKDEDKQRLRKRRTTEQAPPRSAREERDMVVGKWLDATGVASNASCDLAEAESEHQKRMEDRCNGIIDSVRLGEAR